MKKNEKNKFKVGFGVVILSVALLIAIGVIFTMIPRQNVESNSDLICRMEKPDQDCNCIWGEWDPETRERTCEGTGKIDVNDWYYSSTRMGCSADYSSENVGSLGQYASQYGIHHWEGTDTVCEQTETASLPYVKAQPDSGVACPDTNKGVVWESGILNNGAEKKSSGPVKDCELFYSNDGNSYIFKKNLVGAEGIENVSINDGRYYKIECKDAVISGADKVSDVADWKNDLSGNKIQRNIDCVQNKCKATEAIIGSNCPGDDIIEIYDEKCTGLNVDDVCEQASNWTETKIYR